MLWSTFARRLPFDKAESEDAPDRGDDHLTGNAFAIDQSDPVNPRGAARVRVKMIVVERLAG